MRATTIMLGVLAWGLTASAGEAAFTAKPTAVKDGDKVKISFTVSAPTDVEVALLNVKDEVVRHLAAGVLGGKKPPPEPLKAGLAQEILWDGKDDFGKLATGGPFKARVRSGMGAKLGRFIAQDPYVFGGVDAMVVGDDGNLHISGFVGPANESQKTLRVFTPEGKFLKTLLPFPADLPPGAMKEAARWDEAAKTWRPRNLNILNPEFYNSNNGYADYHLVLVSKESGIILVSKDAVYRLDIRGAIPGSAFATGQKPWPVFDPKDSNNNHYGHPFHYHAGPAIFTASADGKYLFLSGPIPNKDNQKRVSEKFPFAAVFRMKLDGKDEMKLFAHIPATVDGPWSKDGGRNYGASGPVHGVCTDLKGNVYVCDREKNRVAVFDDSGKEIGGLSVKNPDHVAVHPKTGEIYVVRRFCNGWNTHSMILDKFKSFEAGAALVTSFTKFHRNNSPQVAVVTSGEKTVLWFAGAATDDTVLAPHEAPRKLLALEDKGAEFQVMPTQYAPKPEVQTDFARIATDPLREEIYVSNGENLIYRYNGETGEGGLLKKDGKPFYAPDLTVGYDGLLYVRSGAGFSGPLERLSRDLAPAPFPATGSNKLYDIYGRYGIGFCEKGVGVGPDGKVYDCWMYDFAKYFVGGFGPDGLPLQGKYLAEQMKASKPVWKDIKLPDERKIGSAIIGPIPADDGGIRVDLKGNIYVGMRLLPKGYTAPAGFEKAPDYVGFTGSVVKFRPEGGAVLGITDSASADAGAPKLETSKNGVVIEGGLAMYPGVAPFSGAGYGGNTSCCVCRVSRFDLDRYGRLALPNVVSTSVTVVDNAGNVICEFGKYGNFDSQYVPPDAKDGKPVIGTPEIPMCWPTGAGFTEKAIYVCDTYNRRVVRADFTWKAEEGCEVK
ncbi:MAG: hypothetical protein NTW87_03475 [Planctomycetota bacterium]|nr:hypothetical protein [Planctomycetota bacterium]